MSQNRLASLAKSDSLSAFILHNTMHLQTVNVIAIVIATSYCRMLIMPLLPSKRNKVLIILQFISAVNSEALKAVDFHTESMPTKWEKIRAQ